MLTNIALVIGGLALLVVGAQSLVRGASRMALALGIAPLIVGLTIVAFGTSAPELAIGIQSSLAGKSAIVLGNAVGSSIYNVLFILGACALLTPLTVAPQLIRLDVPVMIARSEEHTSELQSLRHLVCRLLLEKKKKTIKRQLYI